MSARIRHLAATFAIGTALSAPAHAGCWTDFSGRDLAYFVRNNHMFSGGPSRDGIPSMVNPKVVEPHEVSYVADDELGMGGVINGEARAYPEN